MNENPKKIIYKLPFKIPGIKKNKDTFEKQLINTDKTFHFSAGTLTKEELQKTGFITLNKNKIAILDATFIDIYNNMKRGAQIITPKDIGPIITRTGMNRETIVLDAGSGSGGLCSFLGGIVKKVHTYDVSEQNHEITKKNLERLNLKNVEAKLGNIYDSTLVEENNYDVFVLDVPEPWLAWKTALKTLKIGGFLVVYSPNIIQVRETIMQMPETFFLEDTLEIIEREWSVSEKISRPKTKDFSHTAFLIFFRKLDNEITKANTE